MSLLPDRARRFFDVLPRPSLRGRIFGLVGCGFAASIVMAVGVLWHIRSNAVAASFELASQLAATLADQAAFVGNGSIERHRADLQRLVDFVHRQESRDLEIVDRSLTIVADADPKDVGGALSGAPAAAVAATLADGRTRGFVEPPEQDGMAPRLQLATPIRSAPDAPASAVLVFEYGALLALAQQEVDRAVLQLALVALPALLLLGSLTIWGSRPLLRSVRDLHAAALAHSRGERGHRIGRYAPDELGRLAEAFDDMVQSLSATEGELRAEVVDRKAAQDKLAAANESLEARVSERTALLEATNALLTEELAQRQRVEAQLEQLARFDTLTGLPNRGMFQMRLEQAIARAARHGGKVALMFVDLDRFKSINDSLGHEAGDHVLQQVAARVGGLLRKSDTLCRIGGDEFTVIVEDVDSTDEVAVIAEKIVSAFHKPLALPGGADVYVTLSLGIALSPDDASDVASLMKRADFAMYHAKSDGRNGFRFHCADMSEAAGSRIAIEHALRRALERQEFRLHYQPRVSAQTNAIVGMEALLRWESSLIGKVSPDDFIPVAEETGLIVELGDWVMATAFAQHTAWRRAGLNPGVMAINVSARQMRLKSFAQHVLTAARRAEIAPADVDLELTESMLVADPESAAAMLTELRSHGFGIAIDDFGKGHSSLMHLKRFPATKLKIDRAFVAGIDTNQDDAAIAASIVALANTLSIRVTAEGVETQAQLDVLDGLRCDEYQGFLFGRPASASAFGEFLADANVELLGQM